MDIQRVCSKCRGTGQAPSGLGTSECNECIGTGRKDVGEIKSPTKTLDERLTDLEDKINDVMDKCIDIKEVVDAL